MANMGEAAATTEKADLQHVKAEKGAEDVEGARGETEKGDEGEEEGDEGDEDEGEEATQQGSSLNAKQKKKKKSKAAAKLKKKLGMGGQEGAASSSSGKEAHALTDEQVKQLQQAVEKEQGPVAASKVDRQNLQKLMEMMNLERDALLKSQESKQKSAKAIADHKFWKTQPVTKFGETIVLQLPC